MRKLYCLIVVLFFGLNAFAQTGDTVLKDTAKCALVINTKYPASKPLILIDGVVYKGGVNDLDPNNISEINVVRDTNYVKIYGKAGANGIILITTKGHTNIYNTVKSDSVHHPGLPDDALYVVDGKMSDKKLEGIDPNGILSINVLKEKSSEPMEGSGGRATVMVVTKQGAIKSYMQKFSEFSGSYKKYLDSHNDDDSGLIYSIDGYDCNKGMDGLTRLYQLSKEKISKLKISVKDNVTNVAITTKK